MTVTIKKNSQQPSVFVVQPFDDTSDVVFTMIRSAAERAGSQTIRADQIQASGDIVSEIHNFINNSSLIIADVTHANPNVMYEVGFTKAQNRPILLIAHGLRSVPFNVTSNLILTYDLSEPPGEFINRLYRAIIQAINNPDQYAKDNIKIDKSKKQKVFISYSHNDKEFIDRLLVHLKPLEKEGAIELWVDTRLKAGDKWKKEIEKALQRSTVAILIISADFLASDFITDNELPPILRNAEEHGTRIVPVIAKPCRFTRDKNLKHFQSINDPKKALVLMTLGEQEVIYDAVAEEVERWLEIG